MHNIGEKHFSISIGPGRSRGTLLMNKVIQGEGLYI
jgi:hypothetical protein